MGPGAGRRIAHAVGAPLAAWLVATFLVSTTAWLAGYPPFDADSWIRWDSGLYLEISREGYTLFPCADNAANWCGNAGWFPGYPWLIAALHATGLSTEWSAVAIAWLLRLATLVLMWITFLERRPSAASLGALALAAFAPGAIYSFAAFPLSLLTFATLACLWLLYRERWVAAGLAGAAGVLAYPTGIVLIVVGALWPLFGSRASVRQRLLQCGTVAGFGLAAAALIAVVQRIEVGSWEAYRLVQAKYHHALQLPFRPAGHAIGDLFDNGLSTLASAGPTLQTLLVTLILIAVLAVAIAKRRHLEQVDRLLLLWAVPAWTLAYVQTSVSLYRSEAALLPLALLARRLPVPLLFGLVLAAAALMVVMTTLFLDSTLI